MFIETYCVSPWELRLRICRKKSQQGLTLTQQVGCKFLVFLARLTPYLSCTLFIKFGLLHEISKNFAGSCGFWNLDHDAWNQDKSNQYFAFVQGFIKFGSQQTLPSQVIIPTSYCCCCCGHSTVFSNRGKFNQSRLCLRTSRLDGTWIFRTSLIDIPSEMSTWGTSITVKLCPAVLQHDRGCLFQQPV